MTLRKLLSSKLIHENAEVGIRKHFNELTCTALKVFNRPVKLEDFKPAIPEEWLDRKVDCIFGSEHKYKVSIVLQ